MLPRAACTRNPQERNSTDERGVSGSARPVSASPLQCQGRATGRGRVGRHRSSPDTWDARTYRPIGSKPWHGGRLSPGETAARQTARRRPRSRPRPPCACPSTSAQGTCLQAALAENRGHELLIAFRVPQHDGFSIRRRNLVNDVCYIKLQ